MSEPGLDLEKSNAIGTLDKLTTNLAISTVAVVPTFFICIFMPWRLSVLLDRDHPDGRMGMLLAPGAFFPLSLMVSFIATGLVTTPEILSNNGAFIGPELALSVLTAASNGDIWKIVATIMPIYGFAVFLGLLGSILNPLTSQNWTLRVSLRAAFYVTGVLISWMILTGAAVDLLRISSGNNDIGSVIYPILIIPTSGFILWIYFWFFRNGGTVSWFRSGALSLGMCSLLVAVFWGMDFLIRL